MMTTKSFQIGALVIGSLALTLHVVGFATNHWIAFDYDQTSKFISRDAIDYNSYVRAVVPPNTQGYFGLWKTCGPFFGMTEFCASYSNVYRAGDILREDTFRAVQALETIGLIFLVVACFVLAYSLHSGSVPLKLIFSGIAGGTCILAGAFMMVGVYVGPSTSLSWSFGLSMAGGCLVFVVGILAFIARKKLKQSEIREQKPAQEVTFHKSPVV